MKPGRPSQTAVMVCSWRAFAQGRTPVARYDDPTALQLLPEDARHRVEEQRRAGPPKGMRERFAREFLETRAQMMVARTVEIDDALRGAPNPQVVILGAGLDGRAWRMKELGAATVFEVDQPDSQRDKRSRLDGLQQTAKEVRFVPVDFGRDALADALAAAGHDSALPTTWIWEGVIMYLTKPQVDATLAQIAHRSVPKSRLVAQYNEHAWIMFLLGLGLRRIGEPLRSAYAPAEMRASIERHGFKVTRDENLATVGAALSDDLKRRLSRMKHTRVVTADR